MKARRVAVTGSVLLLLATGAVSAQDAGRSQRGTTNGQGVVYQVPPATVTSIEGAEAGSLAGATASPGAVIVGGGGAQAAGSGAPAPTTGGAGVEIITGGGGGSAGAARVGRMPVLQ